MQSYARRTARMPHSRLDLCPAPHSAAKLSVDEKRKNLTPHFTSMADLEERQRGLSHFHISGALMLLKRAHGRNPVINISRLRGSRVCSVSHYAPSFSVDKGASRTLEFHHSVANLPM